MKKILMCLLGLLMLAACGDDEGDWPTMDDRMPSVNVIYSLSGPGDNGYNDMFVNGLAHFCDSANVALHTLAPTSMDDAEAMVKQWMAHTEGNGQRAMLVLAGSDYEAMAAKLPPMEDENRCILLLESSRQDMPKGVATACIDRKGVMYLAGAMSARTPVYILAAMPDDAVVGPAIKAFCAGYDAHEQGYRVEDVHFLSNTLTGYSMPNGAYKYMAELMHLRQEMSFATSDLLDSRYLLLPMAGNSNTGIYYHLMQSFDMLQSFQGVIGMDVDYSGRLGTLPFSVVIKLDALLRDNIQQWIGGAALPSYHTYTMAEGYADVVVNPTFDSSSIYAMQRVTIEDEDGEFTYIDYLTADYWQQMRNNYLREAEEYEK